MDFMNAYAEQQNRTVSANEAWEYPCDTKAARNLWEDPLPATDAMKKAIQKVKGTFSNNDRWDGIFTIN